MVDKLKTFIQSFNNDSTNKLIESVMNGFAIIFENNIKGGRADNMTIEDIAQKHDFPIDKIIEQLKIGDEVELEHTDNPDIAREIAMDHEAEIPDYYDRLKKMEGDAGIFEGNGFYPDKRISQNAHENLSYRDITIFAIIRLFKSMNDKHKTEFLKQVDGISKWQLDRYPDDYLMRLKENARNMRDDEKDMNRYTPEAKAKEAKRKIRDDKVQEKAYKYQKTQSTHEMDEYESYLKNSDPEAYAEHMYWKEIKKL